MGKHRVRLKNWKNFKSFWSFHLRMKDPRKLGIVLPWQQTQENLILRINSSFDFIFGSLWYFITKCDSYFFTKFDKCLLQNVSGFFITKCNSFMTIYYNCYKMHRFYYKNATVFTNCDDYYKMRRYNHPYQRTVRKLIVNIRIYYFLSMMKGC